LGPESVGRLSIWKTKVVAEQATETAGISVMSGGYGSAQQRMVFVERTACSPAATVTATPVSQFTIYFEPDFFNTIRRFQTFERAL
jgi:hypothetical protein